MHGLSTVLYQ